MAQTLNNQLQVRGTRIPRAAILVFTLTLALVLLTTPFTVFAYTTQPYGSGASPTDGEEWHSKMPSTWALRKSAVITDRHFASPDYTDGGVTYSYDDYSVQMLWTTSDTAQIQASKVVISGVTYYQYSCTGGQSCYYGYVDFDRPGWTSGPIFSDGSLITGTKNLRSWSGDQSTSPYNRIYGDLNVMYQNSWDIDKTFTDDAFDNGTAAVNCSLTDLPCNISKIFNTVSDTFLSVGKAIVNGISWILVPDSLQLADILTNFTDNLTSQLGFINQSLVVVRDLFSNIGSAPAWCNTTSCYLHAPGFLGSDLDIDFLAVKNSMPTLWSWSLITLRAITMVTVILFAIRRIRHALGEAPNE